MNSSHLYRQIAQTTHRIMRRTERPELPDPMITWSVMFSSTVDDLAEERDAADSAVRGLGLIRFRAETFGSLPHTPREICVLLAKRCDIFILVIGKRYGHIIEPEGISVVEFEYTVARDENPGKILVYVKDGVTREPKLEEFLNRLQDFERGHVTSLFTTPEDLSRKIQRDVTRWLASQVTQKPPKKK